jgi:anti-sigma regulatory factor (Ser/Thr protein kinase)
VNVARARARSPRLRRRLAPPTLDGVAAVAAALDAWACTAGVGAERRRELLLSWDELGSNVANHSSSATELRVEARRLASGAAVLTLVDDGALFDPLARARPRTDQALAERAAGGLGIHLVREVAARVDYARRAGRNRLRIELSP